MNIIKLLLCAAYYNNGQDSRLEEDFRKVCDHALLFISVSPCVAAYSRHV
jgi:hypothetical protein